MTARDRMPTLVLTLVLACSARAGQPLSESAANSNKQKLREWMHTYAQETRVNVVGEQGREPAKLVPEPIFRYSDEPREIPDATLWVWTQGGRPVALQKVEVNSYRGSRLWTICFASLSEDLLDVGWPAGSEFKSKAPGVEYKPVPDSDRPASTDRRRILQMKALRDRFSGQIALSGDEFAALRVLPRPIFEYKDAESQTTTGSVFALSSTGTNPDLLLLLEVRDGQAGQPRWTYAVARMTSVAANVRLDDRLVWECPSVPNSSPPFDTWTFYFLGRNIDDPR